LLDLTTIFRQIIFPPFSISKSKKGFILKLAQMRESGGEFLRRNLIPVRSAVCGLDDHETAINRIAHGHAAISVPERQRVEERLRITVGELQPPTLAAVSGLVNSRTFALANAEQISRVGVERLYVPEIQRLGARHGRRLPVRSAVGRLQADAIAPARPRHSRADRADAPQPGGRSARLRLPLGRGALEDEDAK